MLDFSPDVRPLAARMRPTSLDEYVGQSHILAEGKPLRQAIIQGKCHSLILWGPPGTGKTTLAELIGYYGQAEIVRLSAVTAGVKDIRGAISQAQQRLESTATRTLLFVDEVHRFNKSQQDAFLPYIENGTIIFVGATTENPSFALNNAILSRARVFLLKKLTIAELQGVLQRAISDPQQGLAALKIRINADDQLQLCQLADGDARKLLNFIEIASDLCDPSLPENHITSEMIRQVASHSLASIDKQGDQFYDLISALHKSVRGSAPDAALYWYCRMLVAGADPLYVARRLLAIASEDIGNADPRALRVALDAWDIFSRVGPAEGERAIAQAVLYLAVAPKSNAVYTAFKAAKALAEQAPSYEVPEYLRNAPTQLLRSYGYGETYRYAHNEPGAYAAGETYFPTELTNTQFYFPSDRGLEKQIQQKLAYFKQLDLASDQQRHPVANQSASQNDD